MSPMVILEIDFMREIGRVYESGERIFRELSKRSGLAISDTPFADVVFEASAQSWTKDPFDRIIVAEAAVHAARDQGPEHPRPLFARTLPRCHPRLGRLDDRDGTVERYAHLDSEE